METTLSERSCPRCKLRLHRAQVSAIAVEGCGDCGGLWLDNGSTSQVLAQLDPQALSLAAMADSHAKAQANVEHPIACPACSRLLRRVPGGDPSVLVDICDEHGTWFDRGELQKIAALARHYRAHGRVPTVGTAAAVGAAGAVAAAGMLAANEGSITSSGLADALGSIGSGVIDAGASVGSAVLDIGGDVVLEVGAQIVFEGVCALVSCIFEG